jgi:hypothetical protein
MKKFTLIAIFLGILYGCNSLIDVPPVNAWTINLGWDANSELDLKCYNLYYATTQGGYSFSAAPEDVIDKPDTTTSMLVGDGFHCWVLTAEDLVGNESGPSNEVCLTLPNDAPLYDLTSPATPGGFGPIEVFMDQ